jgi:hypothetical protein
MASLTLFQQSEVVRKKQFPIWRTQKFNVLLDFIKKGEVEQIGERDFRIPAETEFGGRAGTYDPQMGDMGRGSMPQGVVMIQSYFPQRLNFEFDKLAIKATTNKSVAIENPFLKCIAKGFQEFMLYRDKWYHGDGTAVLGTAISHSSSSGVSVYTLDGVFGAQLLRRGQYVAVYDSTLATLKSAGVLRITGVSTATPSITLSGVVPSAASTDKICFEGVSGASPAGPRGLAYWISSATSGTTASINRANEPQIISKSVNASSNPYVVEHVMGLYDQILNDRGEVANELLALCAPSQRANAYNNMVAIQNILLDSTTAQAVDRLPSLKGKQAFMYGGVPHYVDIHHDKTKVNMIVPRMFGRAVLAEEDFFQTDGVPGERGRFIQLYGGSGGPAAGTWFGLTCEENPYCVDPGAMGLVSSLPLPAFHT